MVASTPHDETGQGVATVELLTPDEFFERVGVRVPDSVIRNLVAKRGRGEWFVGRYIPITDEIIADACIPDRSEGQHEEQIELLDSQPGRE